MCRYWSSLLEFGEYIRSKALEESTKASIRSQLRSYVLFCQAYDIKPFPVTPVVYQAYIIFLCRSLKSSTSVTNYLNALRHVNLYLGHGVAVMENQDSKLLKRAVHKHLGLNQFRKEEISVQMLVQLVNCLDEHIPLHSCMKALFLVAFFSFLRKSNLLYCARDGPGMYLRRSDVEFAKDSAILKVYRTKTLLFKNRILSVPIPAIPNSNLCPVTALRNHTSLNPAPLGELLFTVRDKDLYRPVSGRGANVFLKRCVESLGWSSDMFSMHSFRRGGATFAFRSGAPAQFIKSQGDWSSDAYLVYLVISAEDKLNVLKSLTTRLQGK